MDFWSKISSSRVKKTLQYVRLPNASILGAHGKQLKRMIPLDMAGHEREESPSNADHAHPIAAHDEDAWHCNDDDG